MVVGEKGMQIKKVKNPVIKKRRFVKIKGEEGERQE
jgi:hypothetical protein